MACVRSLKQLSLTLTTDVTAVQYVFSDEWFLVEPGTVFDFALLLREVGGNFTAKPALQFAAVRPDNPGSPAAIVDGSYTGATDYTSFRETGAVTSGQMWCRVGIAYKLSAGSTLASPQVTLSAFVYGCVEGAGTGEINVQPGMVSGTDLNYVAVTGWFPGVGLTGVMAGIVVTENDSAYSENQLVVRTAIDPRKPNNWQTAEAAYNNPSTTNSERNTGLLTIPSACNLTDNTLAQVGMAWRKKVGAAGNPRAVIGVNVAVVRG